MKQGFTLIELLVVVLIIGILAAIALPQYTKAVEKARAAEAIQLLGDLATAEQIYFMSAGEFTNNLELMDIELPGIDTTVAARNIAYTKNFKLSVVFANPSRFVAKAERVTSGTTNVIGSGDMQYALGTWMDNNGSFARYCGQTLGDADIASKPTTSPGTVSATCKSITGDTNGMVK